MPTLMTPHETAKAMARKLKDSTGKSLPEWVALLRSEGPSEEKPAAKWLKEDRGLGHFQAQLVAKEAYGQSWLADEDPEALLGALYSGKKAGWRALHDRVMTLARKQGKDVKISVCSTYSSAYRKRQFVIARPLVSGLELKLGKDGAKVVLASAADLDAPLETALARAYAGAG
jgi:hypothetical protein